MKEDSCSFTSAQQIRVPASQPEKYPVPKERVLWPEQTVYLGQEINGDLNKDRQGYKSGGSP